MSYMTVAVWKDIQGSLKSASPLNRCVPIKAGVETCLQLNEQSIRI